MQKNQYKALQQAIVVVNDFQSLVHEGFYGYKCP